MYRSQDSSWREQPRTMAPDTLDRTAGRIAEHLGTHGVREAGVVLHGGEPLLAGEAAVGRAASVLPAAAGPGVRLHLALQTNGVRLTERRLDLCAVHGIRVSVSLDGDRAAHDRHRRGADGRGSHARVAAALHRLADGPHRELFTGLLCIIGLRNDPVRCYEYLLTYRPPAVDFLLPQGNWHTPRPDCGPDCRARRTRTGCGGCSSGGTGQLRPPLVRAQPTPRVACASSPSTNVRSPWG
jgi:uncharacterized protein